MATKKADGPNVIEIPTTDIGHIETGILGVTPFIHNRMAEKARHELLLPKGRKNAAERAATLKHDPVAEFRASAYQLADDESPTLLAVMASAFKGSMMTAALDLPGSSKAQIGRLVLVEGHYLPMWGGVKLLMSVTRSADAGKTPDIRTRAISPTWGTIIRVSFVKPLITEQTVINLLSTGGMSSGVGDWRPEKGKGTFGQFRLTTVDDPDLLAVLKNDRAVQTEGLFDAEPFDAESAELLSWYNVERKDRGR